MGNSDYLENKIHEVGCLYGYDLLKDYLQDDYRDHDYLYNFYTSLAEGIERTNLPNCIYESLWGYPEKSTEKKDKNREVINSFNTYMNTIVSSMKNNDKSMEKAFKAFKESIGSSKQRVSQRLVLYFIRNKDIKEKIKKELPYMIQMAKWTNTIGNFILLHETGRGGNKENIFKNNNSKDRMDDYLKKLRLALTKKPEGIFDEELWEKFYTGLVEDDGEKAFRKYINQNYLWDYVNNNYEVRSLFRENDNTEDEEILSTLPDHPKFYIPFAKNIINNIIHRGMFMEIMIRLSIDKEGKNIFNEVKDTKEMQGYAVVIEKIEKIRKKEEIILPKELKSLIKEFKAFDEVKEFKESKEFKRFEEFKVFKDFQSWIV